MVTSAHPGAPGAESHLALQKRLPREDILNVDESGHKENGRRLWTWGFRAASFTCFKIDPSRDSQVLQAMLGKDFAGILGCDYFSAYHKYRKDSGVFLQFCLAHLIRDVKFLATLPEAATVAYSQRLLEALRQLFNILHQREMMEDMVFQQALVEARDHLVAAGLNAPEHKPAQNMAERFRHNRDSYFRFITTPGLEPTNNLAEQAIRFVVLDHHVTQGTRGLPGRQWCQRIWTAAATCQ
jgi:transposase